MCLQPGELLRIRFPSALEPTLPRPKEVGPKEGSGIPLFFKGFLDRCASSPWKKKGTARLPRISGRDWNVAICRRLRESRLL